MVTPEGTETDVVDERVDILSGELPDTGSPVADYMLIAGVLAVTGWFLGTVAAARKPEDTGEEVR